MENDGDRRRLPRGSLTEDLILRTTLDLLDQEGVDAFSMPRLGRELGASATAVYRHFPSRDHIVLGVADLLIGETLDGFEPSEDWVETLRDLALRIWDTYEHHPAAGSITFMRTTRRPHEMRAVDAILGAVLAGGWSGPSALVEYRAFASFVLGIAGAGAVFRALPSPDREGDQAAWPLVYGHLDRGVYPHVASVASHLEDPMSDREIYVHQVDLYLAAMQASSPPS